MSDQFKSSAPRPVDDYVAGWLAVSIALIALIIVGQALWSSAVKAAPIDMECLDPHRTYHVIFDPEAKTFVTETVKDGTTSFVVQSVETPNSSFVVMAIRLKVVPPLSHTSMTTNGSSCTTLARNSRLTAAAEPFVSTSPFAQEGIRLDSVRRRRALIRLELKRSFRPPRPARELAGRPTVEARVPHKLQRLGKVCSLRLGRC